MFFRWKSSHIEMFTRSNWGLTNRARFTGARYTVFVEGGGGNAGQGSDDVIFWKAVFARLRPDLALTLKPLGGKPQLENIARKVALGQVENTIVAMDADFDEILGEKIVCPRVIYSYGYSWENDALAFASVEAVLERLVKVDTLPPNISSAVEESYRSCLKRLEKFINADLYMRMLNSSLFPRVSNGNFIRHVPQTLEPLVDIAPLRQCVVKTMSAIPRGDRIAKPPVSIVDPQIYLQGHSLMFLARKVVSYGVKLFGRSLNVTEDLLVQAIIPVFSECELSSDSFIRSHYERMLAPL